MKKLFWLFLIALLSAGVCCRAEGADTLSPGAHADPGSPGMQASGTKGVFPPEEFIENVGEVLFRIKDATDIDLTLTEEYDDNIFDIWEGDQDWDLVTRLKPALTFTVPKHYFQGLFEGKGKGTASDLVARLDLNIVNYMRHPKLNDSQSLFQPDINFSFNPSDRWKIHYFASIKTQNISNIDPVSSGNEKKQVNTFTDSFGMSYSLGGKWDRWIIDYRHSGQSYEGSEFKPLNRGFDSVSLTNEKSSGIGRLPKFFVNYEGELAVYSEEESRNKLTHEFFAGLKGKMSPKISGTAKAGYGLNFATKSDRSSVGGFVADLSLVYQITKRVKLSIGAKRSMEDVAYIEDPGETGAGGGAGANFNVPEALRTSMEFDVGLDYVPPFFSESLTLKLGASQRQLDYFSGKTTKYQEIGLDWSYAWKKGVGVGIIKSDWKVDGSLRTRRVSPNRVWDRFTDNTIIINLKMEF